MEEIKNLFIKYFGFFPDIISTTEHAYVSPPSRVISSLLELSKFSYKRVLRIVISDNCSFHPESCVRQICIPHILNKKMFYIDDFCTRKELLQKFNEDTVMIEGLLNNQKIFSLEERKNYTEIICQYKKAFEDSETIDSVSIYNCILNTFVDNFQLDHLKKWISHTDLFVVDSKLVRSFLKEAFVYLKTIDPSGVGLFRRYMETRDRLKLKNSDGSIRIMSWDGFFDKIEDDSVSHIIPFEMLLYVYSYCGGSHFGNDYGIVSDINGMQKNNNLLQITEHNKDYLFKIEEENVQFQKASFLKNSWTLSHKMYKTIGTLPELQIVLGKDSLKSRFKDLIIK